MQDGAALLRHEDRSTEIGSLGPEDIPDAVGITLRTQIRGYDLRLRHRRMERACHDAGTRGGLENAVRLEKGLGDDRRTRLGL